MKATEVLKILRISRPTLYKYLSEGKIRAVKLSTGHWDYDRASVYEFLQKGVRRKTYIYARVSTSKQKKDLENQIQELKQFCFRSGYKIDGIFTDIASGISFEKRKEFFIVLDEILRGEVEQVVISYKDRLSRVGFGLFQHLFEHFSTQIIVMSEVGSIKLDTEEIFEEIVSLLHCYSMKMYSKRKSSLIRQLIEASNGENN